MNQNHQKQAQSVYNNVAFASRRLFMHIDTTFFAAFQRYASDWAFKHPYPNDFWNTFRDVAGNTFCASTFSSSDAGLARDEHHPAGHEPAAQHPVQLGQAGRLHSGTGDVDLPDP